MEDGRPARLFKVSAKRGGTPVLHSIGVVYN